MLTPFQFASNMPISAIDLDGKEANVSIEIKTNIIIVVLSASETRHIYSGLEGVMGNVQILFSTDIEDGFKQAKAYLGDVKATNLALDLHGSSSVGVGGQSSQTIVTSYDSKDQQLVSIDRFDMFQLIKNKGITEERQEKAKDVKALSNIIKLVGEGGNMIIVGCEVGQDADFCVQLYKQANDKITLYANQDLTTRTTATEVTDGQKGKTKICYSTEPENSNNGWVKYNSKDNRTEIVNIGTPCNVEICTENNCQPVEKCEN